MKQVPSEDISNTDSLSESKASLDNVEGAANQTESFIKEKCPEKATENPPLKRLSKKTFGEKLQKKLQKVSKEESLVETRDSKQAKKDLTNDEISKLAWNLKK